MSRTASLLLEELRTVDESTAVEAKTGAKIDRSILETVCAFANEPGLGGGHILLGVAASHQLGLFGRDYEVCGVPDPDRLQSDLATQCATAFNRPIRPVVTVERLEDKPVLVVFVAELAPTEKPLFLKALGLPRGAFRRIGPTDQEGTDDDLIALFQGHQVDTYDGSTVRDATLRDIDPEAIRLYREMRTAANPVAEELTWSDEDLLRALGCIAIDGATLRPTVAGILLFGTTMALRRCFPMMRLDYIRLPGKEWVADPDRRFDTIEIRAPLVLAARRAIAAVRDDLPASFNLPEGETIRSDETILPIRVLREAIVNAVMHRSYRIHGPAQILRYANRLEIRNPGHSLKADELLGEPGSQTRNPRIAAVLHDLHLAETKGSGIRVMRELMLQNDLIPPTFESSRRPDQFVATFLFHHFLGEADVVWLRALTPERLSDEEARALIFVREVGAIDNAAYRSINRTDTLAASSHLRRLRDLEILDMHGSGNRTYYVPGRGFVAATPVGSHPTSAIKGGGEAHKANAETHKANAETHKVHGQTPNPLPETRKASATSRRPDLPDVLAERLAGLSRRPRAPLLQELIVELCAWQALSARELAELLGGRDPRDLTRTYLRPLVAAGRLAYTVHQMPNHPDQKYLAPRKEPE